MSVILVKSANVPSAVLGGTITYTIMVRNGGPDGATNVVVSDPLAPGITFVAESVTLNGNPISGASIVSGVPLGTIAAGAVQTVAFQASVTSLPAPTADNTSSAAYIPEGLTETVTVISNQVSTPIGLATVTVAKSANLPDLTLGDTMIYTSVITNSGTEPLTNVSFSDPVPLGASFVPGSVLIDSLVSPEADPGAGIQLSDIGPGDSVTVAFFVTVTSLPPGGSITNTSSVSYASGGGIGSNLSDAVARRVFVPIYSIIKSADKSFTFVGDIITYSIAVTNNGNITSNLSLIDPVQPGATFIANTVTINGVTIPGARPGLGIAVGNVQLGVLTTIQYQVRVNTIPSPAFVTNTVTGTYDTFLPSGRAISGPAGSSSISVFVVDPRISLQLETAALAAMAGETIVYTLTATNLGNANAQLTVASTIPDGSQFVGDSVTVDGTALPGIDPEQGVDLGAIAPGQSIHVTYQVIVLAPPQDANLFTVATGVGLYEDAIPANVSPASLIVAVLLAEANLSTVASFVLPGNTVSFSLVVVNESTTLALDSIVSFISLPQGLEFIPGSVTVNGISVAVASLEAGIPVGTLAPGAEIGISLSVQVTDTDASGQPISASVQYSVNQQGLYTVPSNTLQLIVVTALPQVTKQVDAAQVSPGDIVSYTIQAAVPSGQPLSAVLSDTLPAGLQYVPGSLLLNGSPSDSQDLTGGVPLGLISTDNPVTIFFRASVLTVPESSISQPLQASNSGNVIFSTGDNTVTIVSSPAVSVITTAAYRISATPSTTVSEAGEVIAISISLSVIGSQAANGSLSGFVPAGFVLLDESLTIDGQPASLVNQSLPLGELNPGAIYQIQFSCLIPSGFIAVSTSGSAVLSYNYSLEERLYRGTAIAPSYQVFVEQLLE